MNDADRRVLRALADLHDHTDNPADKLTISLASARIAHPVVSEATDRITSKVA